MDALLPDRFFPAAATARLRVGCTPTCMARFPLQAIDTRWIVNRRNFVKCYTRGTKPGRRRHRISARIFAARPAKITLGGKGLFPDNTGTI